MATRKQHVLLSDMVDVVALLNAWAGAQYDRLGRLAGERSFFTERSGR
ncbi:MAG TPA: hypothetical protein VEK76_10785 [Candidatus Binatia bacterium]|nr:hypothetical protein [Candidatus Binatia bacterium]